jgi:bleomycin hydrolase
MSDGWYKEWVYQIACNKKYLDDSLLKILNQRPTKLPAWDPMGALAK